MQVTLHYNRLAKTGLYFGLELKIRLEISSEEIHSLNPTWYIAIPIPWLGATAGVYESPFALQDGDDRFELSTLDKLFDTTYPNKGYRFVLRGTKYIIRCSTFDLRDGWPHLPRLFFRTEQQREAFVRTATFLCEEIRKGIQSWLEQHKAVKGDDTATRQTFAIDMTSDRPQATRVIRHGGQP